ncbi:MAG: glycerate kinase [Lachnospiraceae bacterium]|nr:glycerate kinase [Lachnospiraceae bacterium]
MKIAVFMDSLKGSLTSTEAGAAVKEGILSAWQDAEVVVCPFADGGEGTLDAFLAAGGKTETARVSDPLGRSVEASYGILNDGTCVIESAKAIGLYLLDEGERNPLHTTTRGLGQIIEAAIERGAREFIIGIGGSSTNDCGIGMLQALRFDITDKQGNPVEQGAAGLEQAATIAADHVIPGLSQCNFLVACDVQNLLCGANGASMVYGPQKGASKDDCQKMDRWMERFAELVKEAYPNADPNAKGAGAAGGLGFAFRTFLSAKMRSGADILFEKIQAQELIESADLVITGEGRIDGQTAMGKAPVKVAAMAKKYHKRVLAFAGCIGEGAEKCLKMGIDAYYPITSESMPIEEAMKKEVAYQNLKNAVEYALRQMDQDA